MISSSPHPTLQEMSWLSRFPEPVDIKQFGPIRDQAKSHLGFTRGVRQVGYQAPPCHYFVTVTGRWSMPRYTIMHPYTVYIYLHIYIYTYMYDSYMYMRNYTDHCIFVCQIISDLQADLLIPPLANTINTCAATPTFRAACTSFAGTSAIQKVHRALMHREWSWDHCRLKWNEVDSKNCSTLWLTWGWLHSDRFSSQYFFVAVDARTPGTRRRCDASAATRGVISRRRGIQIMEFR